MFDGDESFIVLEGSTTISLPDTGERIELHSGDLASFAKGIAVGLDIQRAIQEIHRHLRLKH